MLMSCYYLVRGLTGSCILEGELVLTISMMETFGKMKTKF